MASANSCQTPWAHAFDMVQTNPGEFSAQFPRDFCYGTRAHGGTLVGLASQAIRLHFRQSKQRPDLADILESKTSFLRMATFGATTITIEELSVSRSSATVIARLSQNGKLNMVLMATIGNLLRANGPTFETNWALDPRPHPADTLKMARNEDPEWLSYQVPWDPKSFVPFTSHAVQFFPARSHENKTIRDLWLQAIDVDPNFGWTNNHLEYLADMALSPLESWQGEKGAGSHSSALRYALEQKADREAGKPLQAKLKAFSPFNSFSTSMNVDVKKRLPAEGVKFLFARTTSRLAKNGRMDWDITIHDEGGDLVAIVYGLHQIVELRNVPLPGTAKGSTAPKL